MNALQEAVSNIVDIVFKYVKVPKPGSTYSSDLNPKVVVHLEANEPSDSSGVMIWVEDNGHEIPQDEEATIFQRG